MTRRSRIRVASLEQESRLELAVDSPGLSARAFVKVLRVARAIAHLEGEERVRVPHVAEAIRMPVTRQRNGDSITGFTFMMGLNYTGNDDAGYTAVPRDISFAIDDIAFIP